MFSTYTMYIYKGGPDQFCDVMIHGGWNDIVGEGGKASDTQIFNHAPY